MRMVRGQYSRVLKVVGASFACLTEDDWLGYRLMTEREWDRLERKVYQICQSRPFTIGKSEDTRLSAQGWGHNFVASKLRLGSDKSTSVYCNDVEHKKDAFCHQGHSTFSSV